MRNATLVILFRLALFAAVFASAVLLIEYRNAGDPAFCGAGTGCMAVRLSSYSKFAGVPLPLIGLVAFSGLLLFAVFAREVIHLRMIAALCIGGAAVAVGLFYLQLSVIRALCKWCVIVDSGAIIAVVLAIVVERIASRSKAAEDEILAAGRDGRLSAVWVIGAGIAAAIPSIWARYPVIPPLPAPIAAMQVPGKLTIVSFTDFQCPFCRALHPLMEATRHDHGDRVAIVRKMAPLPMHPGARPAALAYLCVPEDKREEMAHALYSVPDALLTRGGTVSVAAGLGLDEKTVAKCVDSPETRARLDEDFAVFEGLATKALPLTFIGSRTVMGYSEDRTKSAVAIGLAGDQPSLPVTWMIAAVFALGAGLAIYTRRELSAAAAPA